MDGIKPEDMVEMLATLKAQQNADTEIIKCLIAAIAGGVSLQEAWRHQVSQSVVEEQLFAQSNAFAKVTLEAFNERVKLWDTTIRKLGEP